MEFEIFTSLNCNEIGTKLDHSPDRSGTFSLDHSFWRCYELELLISSWESTFKTLKTLSTFVTPLLERSLTLFGSLSHREFHGKDLIVGKFGF